MAYSSCARSANPDNSGEPSTIEMPAIPSDLRDPNQRADFLISHFWDNLDFKDTVRSHNRALLEQSFVDFLSVLPYASSDSVITNGFSILLDKSFADPYSYRIVTQMAEDYLSDPDSPMISEEQYLCFLNALKDSPNTSEVHKARIADRMEMIGKNRVGTKAADFTFSLLDGSESSLAKSLPSPGTDLMLIFFDPDCESCDEVMSVIKTDTHIGEAVYNGTLKVLAIYSGENFEGWKKKAVSLPSEWTIGYNESEIDEGELYYLPSMPTVYILDSNGIVMQKDLRF